MPPIIKNPFIINSYLYWFFYRAISKQDKQEWVIKIKAEIVLGIIHVLFLLDVFLTYSWITGYKPPSKPSFIFFWGIAFSVLLLNRLMLFQYDGHKLLFNKISPKSRSTRDIFIIIYIGILFIWLFVYRNFQA